MMGRPRFDRVFTHATGCSPFDYQCRLACGESSGRDRAEWLQNGRPGESLLVNVPTGCGKTAAVVLAWLWNRAVLGCDDWPRRLAYCLPMRILVEQTRDNVRGWLRALADWADLPAPARARLASLVDRGPVVLMGGEGADDWELYPDREAIIVGTQDLLLSRALNRGYASSRARWPLHFGLLNTDCLWVFDEVQLMGPGLATTTQLEAFRWLLGASDGHRCHSIWMSATLQRNWLETIDFRDRAASLHVVTLTAADLAEEDIRSRWNATKPSSKADAPARQATSLAPEVRASHRSGTRTIVVVNTVRFARELFDALRRPGRTAGKRSLSTPAGPSAEVLLLHSRFRSGDRRRAVERMLAAPPPAGSIVVSTQVIEAGVDISAATLFTELAPWASLVQRFGRCNRRGECNDLASVRWLDVPVTDKDALPYALDGLKESASRLAHLTNVGPSALPAVDLSFEHDHVVRRKDLLDLFDTSPDLGGNDLDIDRFVRDVDETDVRVFWRDWHGVSHHEVPPDDEPGPRGDELCPAPIGEFRDFVQKGSGRGKAWRWDFLDGRWTLADVRLVAPGQVYLLHADAGGYAIDRGWDPQIQGRVEPLASDDAQASPFDATDTDPLSHAGGWQTIAEHTADVCLELDEIVSEIPLAGEQASALRLAARWHDRGKAHDVFQDAVDDGQEVAGGGDPRHRRPEQWRGCRFIAKAPERARTGSSAALDGGFWRRYSRRHFRHELASALAVLDPRNTTIPDHLRDLVAFVVAAHHGKVRLSIRSLPEEARPRNRGGGLDSVTRFARGVWDGDTLAVTDLGGGVEAPATVLFLEPMELGLCREEPFVNLPSWSERMIRLRDALGPFALAYLEALLRTADMRASRSVGRAAGQPRSEDRADA